MPRITVTASNITETLYAAVCAHYAADPSYGTTEPGYGEAAAHVTSLCGDLDAANLARRATFEAQNGESERAAIMSAELERRNR